MNWNEILNIVLAILGVVITLVGYYFKIKETLIKNANDKINEAEKDAVNGKEKMEYVVNELYALVPLPYKPLFSKEFIEKLVQEIFNKIESYAEKQVEKNKPTE